MTRRVLLKRTKGQNGRVQAWDAFFSADEAFLQNTRKTHVYKYHSTTVLTAKIDCKTDCKIAVAPLVVRVHVAAELCEPSHSAFSMLQFAVQAGIVPGCENSPFPPSLFFQQGERFLENCFKEAALYSGLQLFITSLSSHGLLALRSNLLETIR